MSRRLNDLSPRFRPIAVELLAQATEAGVPLVIVNTRRTPEQQAENVAKGVSWTLNSLHLTGDAIDVCPYSQYAAHGDTKLLWDAGDPIWQRLGVIGEALGLRWGGRWAQKDMGHFEMVPLSPHNGPVVA